jgi:hypothetical protein
MMSTIICSGDGPVLMTTLDAASCPFGNKSLRDGKLHPERWRQLCCHLAQAQTPDQRAQTFTTYCDTFGLKHKVIMAMVHTYAPGLLP